MPLHWARFLTVAAMGLAAWLWGGQQQAALDAHQLQWGQDLAFFHQILFHASKGDPWTCSLLLEPTGFFSMVHFHPVFAAVVPMLVLWPGPETLLWLNVLAIVWTAWPLAELGREASGGRPVMGLAAGLAWLVWMPAQSAALADFRPMVFLVPGLAWLLWGVYQAKGSTWLLGAALCIAAREEASYLLMTAGLVFLLVPWGGKRRAEGLKILGLGAAFFVFLLLFKDNFFFHFDPREALAGLGEGPGVPESLTDDRSRFLLQSWLGGYLLAPLAPASLLVSGGPLFWLLGDTHREWHGMTGTTIYLRDALLPLLAASGTLGMAWVARRGPRVAYVAAIGLVAGNVLSFQTERGQMRQRAEDLVTQAQSAEVYAIDALLNQVDRQDRVGTDYRLIAALSGRKVLWNVSHLYLDDAPPPYWTVEWPLTLNRLDTLVILSGDPMESRLEGWTLQDSGGGYNLWRREEEPPGGMPEPLP